MAPSATTLTIGRLAKAAGVNVETIRYYQRIGLIVEPPKPVSGYRNYPADAIARLRFIRHAQGLGFTLTDIKELLSLNDGDCRQARRLAEQKHSDVQRRLQDLQKVQRALAGMIDACRESESRGTRCALIDALK